MIMSHCMRRGVATAALLTLLGGCTYSIKSKLPDPPPAAPAAPMLVALLSSVDVRLGVGGGKTHVVERQQRPSYDGSWRYPYPLDPWSNPGGWWGMPPPRTTEETRVRATGELGTLEILVPMEDAFARRFKEFVGDQNVRDATTDPLAEEPNLTRALAFLDAYPAYDAAVWLEVIEARADLPDVGGMQSLFTIASMCSLGALSWLFFIPVNLDTPVTVRARAYLVRRGTPAVPVGAAEASELEVEARGSVAFDVDAFRADVADLAATRAGRALAEALAARLQGSAPVR